MSGHSALFAALLLFASAGAAAAPDAASAERKARSDCRSMTRGWDIDLPARACDDPRSRIVAMRRAHELCERERMRAAGALRTRRCMTVETH